MENLTEQKTDEQIALLKKESKVAQIKLYLELSKTFAIFLGAIVVFWFIQQPESILNRASSKETIARERAKLMLEWIIKENDLEKQADALAVIKAAYGESNDEWIQKFELRLQRKAQATAVNKLLEQHAKLVEKSHKLRDDIAAEEAGANSGIPGRGPTWRALRNELASTEFEIKNILEQLTNYGFDVTKIEK